jgi:hypothetical protein
VALLQHTAAQGLQRLQTVSKYRSIQRLTLHATNRIQGVWNVLYICARTEVNCVGREEVPYIKHFGWNTCRNCLCVEACLHAHASHFQQLSPLWLPP